MSDDVRATGFGCCDRVGGDFDGLVWIIILIVIFCCLCGDNLFGRGCCR